VTVGSRLVRPRREAPRTGDQLELDLFAGIPWGGHSPRGLTRAGKALFLRPEPQGHGVEVDPMQLLMWPVASRPRRKSGPQQAAGAPSLLPLPRRRRGGSRKTFIREDYDA